MLLDLKHNLEQIDQKMTANENKEINLAIIYGAAHMRAIIKDHVEQQNYKITETVWLDVIKL